MDVPEEAQPAPGMRTAAAATPPPPPKRSWLTARNPWACHQPKPTDPDCCSRARALNCAAKTPQASSGWLSPACIALFLLSPVTLGLRLLLLLFLQSSFPGTVVASVRSFIHLLFVYLLSWCFEKASCSVDWIWTCYVAKGADEFLVLLPPSLSAAGITGVWLSPSPPLYIHIYIHMCVCVAWRLYIIYIDYYIYNKIAGYQ